MPSTEPAPRCVSLGCERVLSRENVCVQVCLQVSPFATPHPNLPSHAYITATTTPTTRALHLLLLFSSPLLLPASPAIYCSDLLFVATMLKRPLLHIAARQLNEVLYMKQQPNNSRRSFWRKKQSALGGSGVRAAFGWLRVCTALFRENCCWTITKEAQHGLQSWCGAVW